MEDIRHPRIISSWPKLIFDKNGCWIKVNSGINKIWLSLLAQARQNCGQMLNIQVLFFPSTLKCWTGFLLFTQFIFIYELTQFFKITASDFLNAMMAITVTPIVHWAGNIKSNRKHDTGEMGLYKLYCSLYIYLPQCFINSNQIKLEHMIRWHIHCINSLKTDDLWGGLLKYLLSLGLVH